MGSEPRDWRCPKCGEGTNWVRYVAPISFFGFNVPEALRVTCFRCGHEWREKTDTQIQREKHE